MTYVVLKPLGGGGSGDTRQPGDVVPEAAQWPLLRRMLEHGFLAKVVDGKEAEFVAGMRGGELPRDLCPSLSLSELVRAARWFRKGPEAKQQAEVATEPPKAEPPPAEPPPEPTTGTPAKWHRGRKHKDG